MPQPGVFGQPQYDFPGATMGAPFNYPSIEGTDTFQFRYSHTWTRDKHEFKFGGEYLNAHDSGTAYYSAFGRMTFLSLPSSAEMARRFPIDQWNNPAAWDLSGLDAIVQRFDLNSDAGSGDIPPWNYDVPRPTYALWFGDVWRLSPKLTVNYGLRWDDDWGAAAPPGITENSIPIDNRFVSGDFGFRQDIYDHKNFAPRGGFSYNVGGKNDFVVRGGTGLYYATPVSNVTYSQQLYNRFTFATFNNDGRPGFATDPTRGVTSDDILTGRVPLPAQTTRILSPDFKMPYTWQYSAGFQKQLGSVMAIESDLAGWQWYRDTRSHDPNLFYDPATGYNVEPEARPAEPEVRPDLLLHQQRPPRLSGAVERLHAPPAAQLPGRHHPHPDVLHARRRIDRLLEQRGEQRLHGAGERVGALGRLPAQHRARVGALSAARAACRSAARTSTARGTTTRRRSPARRTASPAPTA